MIEAKVLKDLTLSVRGSKEKFSFTKHEKVFLERNKDGSFTLNDELIIDAELYAEYFTTELLVDIGEQSGRFPMYDNAMSQNAQAEYKYHFSDTGILDLTFFGSATVDGQHREFATRFTFDLSALADFSMYFDNFNYCHIVDVSGFKITFFLKEDCDRFYSILRKHTLKAKAK